MTAKHDEALRIMRENAGAIESRVRRETGLIVTVYRTAEAGLDVDAGPYTLICEEHSHTIAVDTLALAKAHAACPLGWCEVCMYPDEWIEDEVGCWVPVVE